MTKRGLGITPGCFVRKEASPDPSRLARFVVTCGKYDEQVGWVTAAIRENEPGERPRRYAIVGNIEVDSSYHRHGNATALYEAVARWAASKRVRLRSVERTRDAHSHDFWRKQHAKGRARIVGENAYGPIFELLPKAAKGSLAGVKRRAPKRKRPVPKRTYFVCSVDAFRSNIRHNIHAGKAQPHAVAAAYGVLYDACGVKRTKRRRKPEAIVAARRR